MIINMELLSLQEITGKMVMMEKGRDRMEGEGEGEGDIWTIITNGSYYSIVQNYFFIVYFFPTW